MSTYQYVARSRDGTRVESTVNASSKADALKAIEARGEVPVSIAPAHGPSQVLQSSIASHYVRDQMIYRLLAFFTGFFGLHDFYAGRLREGVLIIILSIMAWFLLPFLYLAIFGFVIYEMITVSIDGDGRPMKKSAV